MKVLNLYKVATVISSGVVFALFTAIYMIGVTTLNAQSQSCHLITTPAGTPQGYASPVSYFTNDLLIKADCSNSNSVAVTVGNNSQTTYIYQTSYQWTGTSWKAVTLTGNDKDGPWIKQTATKSFTSTQVPTYYVAYTCEYVNNSWKCGCTTQSCTQSQWQLQIVNPASGNQGGDSGGSAGGGTTSANQNSQCQVTPSNFSGDDIRIVGGTRSGELRVRNAENVLIENVTFRDGKGIAIRVYPCTVKNVTIRNNRFEDWSGGGILVGSGPHESECSANIVVENNIFIENDSKFVIETKTSGVMVRGNTSTGNRGAINLRHGRNVRVIDNNIEGGYWVMGDTHYLSGNKGGSIRLAIGQATQDTICINPKPSKYPVARNVTLTNNQSSVTTFSWSGGSIAPTCSGNDCPAAYQR